MRREGADTPDYLRSTLDALLNRTSEAEKATAVIVVMLTDAQREVREERAKQLYDEYAAVIDAGATIVHTYTFSVSIYHACRPGSGRVSAAQHLPRRGVRPNPPDLPASP